MAENTNMDDRHELLLDEVRTRVILLKKSLPRELDGYAVSDSKLPFKVLLYREALMWRMAELSDGACRHFEADDLISGIVLTRAVTETAAALWYLHGKVDAAISSGSVSDIDTYLMKLNFGTTTVAVEPDDGATALPRPVKVRDFMKAVDVKIEGFSRRYGVLSDYAHPNWAGTTLTYTNIDHQTGIATLGKNLRHDEFARNNGLSSLSGALAIFELRYNGLSDLLPEFVRLSEAKTSTANPRT
jgi:hypothetical protein